MICIDLLRHGEPTGGLRYRGSGVDDPLTQEGWRQMWEAVGGQMNPGGPWDRLVSSPMARCQDFAEQLSQRLSLPLAIEPAIREVGFGAWEGRSHDDLKLNRLDEYLAFFQDPVKSRPEGAEPLGEFRGRVSDALARVETRYRGQHVLLVTHAGVIRAGICAALDVPLEAMYRIKVPYAGLTRLRRDERGLMLEFVNRTRVS
ncbi:MULTISPECIES: histidine phosphatase family protein [unclassified Ectothiorhodospira]|uniref:histidine phosphatase family protein n=1 Tax=unclassified Ectothiorhodospira TaxID=2684909 RepID=UPI002102EBCF|nr:MULTISPECIES: histidine phosphatase family protein [unclassified Ectothiorhodospira]